MNATAMHPQQQQQQQQQQGLLATLVSYNLEGIDFALAGNGGPECAASLGWGRRLAEDAAGVALSASSLALGLRWHRPPPDKEALGRRVRTNEYAPARVALLVAMTFAYALEFGYKMATRQMIFLHQPCHQLCLVQMLLLSWPANSRWITYVYRVHLFFLHGPVMAVIFPVNNTLFLPGEVFTYWLEHALLLIIPFYLLRHGGMFTVEKTSDLSWALLSYGVWGLYHFGFLEAISILSWANLNCMLCPAITDPIGAPNWRLFAIFHQFLFNLVSGKLFGLLGKSEEAELATGGEDHKEKPS